ncbi:ATP-binding protein [Methylobacterium pseudosasicola]|uniref:TniB protein n=1 Tax=Methylobacterium pseudosasicola TaxID=582667 RepID=A0A1I4PU89_9HYPH|nr:ATP-binding protein [Methylobacterium pseudosasicola]SFM31116.1 TniB protein [Methylobacterium pseudosasicola]
MNGRRTGAGFENALPLINDPNAAFEAMRAKMPARDQEIMRRLDALEEVYVECGRDKVLSEAFATFMRKYLTRKLQRRKHANVFFLTGPSGAGKTEAVERLLRQHPALQPEQTSYGIRKRYVSISLKGYVLPRIIAENIMTAAGHPVGKTGRGDAWNHVTDALMRRGVSLVHIDETQHIVKDKGKEGENEELANAIKGISNSPTWPIAFVLSGLPRIIKLPFDDEQFERRYRWVDFPDLDMDKERMLVVRILRKLTAAVGMNIGNMSDTDTPERLAHSCRNRYARVCEGVVEAIHLALDADLGTTELTREHFAQAWTNQTRAAKVKLYNPFIVDDWSGLPAGSYLGVPGDERE